MRNIGRFDSVALVLFGAVVVALANAAGCGESVDGPKLFTSGTTTASGNGGTGGTFTIGTGGATVVDCAEPCEPGEICSHGVCLPTAPCQSDEDCWYDTYCDPLVGCLPWQEHDPPHDPDCVQIIASGVLAPTIQCEFDQPPMGDAFPNHVDVQATPIVINLNKSNNVPDEPGPGPSSIVATFTATVAENYTEDLGVIRVIGGKDCKLEANLGGVDLDNDNTVDWIVSSSSLAAADLDGDGLAEIVAYGADGSTLAFTYKSSQWSFLWKAPLPAGAPWTPCTSNHRCALGWGGMAIHDLDDDGVPEVIREGVVLSASGQLLSMQPAEYASYMVGLFSVMANLDQDADMELSNGQFVWAWQAGQWVKEAYFPGGSASAPGHVAVADFGAYGSDVPATNPEIAVVRGGSAMIYAITGELVQGPLAIPGGGSGGPPTISDFDGDGLAELAVAAKGAYTVYDIDCGANPRPNGICPPGQCDYNGGTCPSEIAWSRQSQDISSSVTGSSVFDFEADGSAEVVYADECFTRVYSGSTGEVLFSQFRSSCTWHENPIIADVDGDFRAELVTPSNKACSIAGAGMACNQLNADGVDPLFNGLRCQTGADCVSAVCDQGLCRCTATSQCCGANVEQTCLDEGFKCVAPEPGTAGAGNTCRSAHPTGVSGIRVYSDANDQWVTSRRIWNQHAYAVTHVNENGTIPKTSNWKNNWQEPNLNNFRQNVPGQANATAIGDTTAGASKSYICSGAGAELSVQICNRGGLAIAAGVPIGFYVDDNKICSTETTLTLFPDDCETVTCMWASPPNNAGQAADVKVVADDGNSLNECKEGNNIGGVFGVFCQPAS